MKLLTFKESIAKTWGDADWRKAATVYHRHSVRTIDDDDTDMHSTSPGWKGKISRAAIIATAPIGRKSAMDGYRGKDTWANRFIKNNSLDSHHYHIDEIKRKLRRQKALKSFKESIGNLVKAVKVHAKVHIDAGNPAFKGVAKLMGRKMGTLNMDAHKKHLAKMRQTVPNYGLSAAEGGPKVWSDHGIAGAHVKAIKDKMAYLKAMDARNKVKSKRPVAEGWEKKTGGGLISMHHLVHKDKVGPHEVEIWGSQSKKPNWLGRRGNIDVGFAVDGKVTKRDTKVSPEHHAAILKHIQTKVAQLHRRTHGTHDHSFQAVGATSAETQAKQQVYDRFFQKLGARKK